MSFIPIPGTRGKIPAKTKKYKRYKEGEVWYDPSRNRFFKIIEIKDDAIITSEFRKSPYGPWERKRWHPPKFMEDCISYAQGKKRGLWPEFGKAPAKWVATERDPVDIETYKDYHHVGFYKNPTETFTKIRTPDWAEHAASVMATEFGKGGTILVRTGQLPSGEWDIASILVPTQYYNQKEAWKLAKKIAHKLRH